MRFVAGCNGSSEAGGAGGRARKRLAASDGGGPGVMSSVREEGRGDDRVMT